MRPRFFSRRAVNVHQLISRTLEGCQRLLKLIKRYIDTALFLLSLYSWACLNLSL